MRGENRRQKVEERLRNAIKKKNEEKSVEKRNERIKKTTTTTKTHP